MGRARRALRGGSRRAARWCSPRPISSATGYGSGGGELPEDRRLHQAALAYASDLTLLSATTVPHNVFIGINVMGTSLDHAMWFHRPFRADDWLLYDQVSPSASGGLGLATARLFQHGTLVADVARWPDPPTT